MNENIEENLFNNIEKKRFFDLIDNENIDISKVCVKKKEYNDHFHRFNILVNRLKEDENKSIIDIAVYLYEDYFTKLQDVWSCFDENNTWTLQEEIEIKKRKGNVKSILDHFLFL